MSLSSMFVFYIKMKEGIGKVKKLDGFTSVANSYVNFSNPFMICVVNQ